MTKARRRMLDNEGFLSSRILEFVGFKEVHPCKVKSHRARKPL